MGFFIAEELKNSLRLSCTALLMGGDKDFKTLKALTNATDGNLSVQLSHLEKAGFLSVEKGYLGRRPHSVYHLTQAGRDAFTGYVALLQKSLAAGAEKED